MRERDPKPIDQLRVAELKRTPVWEYSGGGSETEVGPVTGIPVSSLTGRIVGTEVLLANSTRVWR